MQPSILFLISFFFILSCSLTAQVEMKMPKEPKSCYLFLEELLVPERNKAASIALVEFKGHQQRNELTATHYHALEFFANELLEKEAPQTAFCDLLFTINAFAADKKMSAKYLDKWWKVGQKMVRKTIAKTSFLTYLNWSRDFWTAREFSSSASKHRWKVDELPTQISYENAVLIIKYNKTNLSCIHRMDSLRIEGTEGIYYPFEGRWEGSGGQVSWRENKGIYAVLKKYTIYTKNPFYKAINATLYDKTLFAKPLLGTLEDRVPTHQKKRASYPIFESTPIVEREVEEGIQLTGNWNRKGEIVTVTGAEKKRALIRLYNNKGQKVAKIQSPKLYWLPKHRIESFSASITLYLHQKNGALDSINHPEVNLVYDLNTRMLFLGRSKSTTSLMAYTNSLQKMEMNVATIRWKIDSHRIEFGDNTQNMTFYSEYYFDEALLSSYEALGTSNPLIQMGLYGTKIVEAINANLSDSIIEPWNYWIDANVMALLLDKRMEKITLMTANEIQRARKNKAFKIIERNQDFREFVKGFPTLFKFAAMDVEKLTQLISNTNFDQRTALPLHLQMVQDGFLWYDKETGKLCLRKKIFHYLAAINQKQKEYRYDKIKLFSLPSHQNKENVNAVLDPYEGNLSVWGIQPFVLSDSQKVVARPLKSVHLGKDRSIHFNGQVIGGDCHFTGNEFRFDYERYDIELTEVNFMDFFIYKRAQLTNRWGQLTSRRSPLRAVDRFGRPTKEKEALQSVLEEVTGKLWIDVPNNKSGREKSDRVFPFFESTSTAKVYYNKRNRQGKDRYPRASFYYELKPFRLNGMDELKPSELFFEGTLHAGGIFQPIEEPLTVMYHDLSLGFETRTKGLLPSPIYIQREDEGIGHYKGAIGLSNEGLIGNGSLTYLGAKISSDYIKFLPELVQINQVDSFLLEASIQHGSEFPKVLAEKIQVHWLPYQDSMHLISPLGEGFPFQLFDEKKCFLDGALLLTKKGLSGTGTIDWKAATIEANPKGSYHFGQTTLHSSSAAILLKATGSRQFGFENENVALTIDFKTQIADFIVQEANLMTELPYNGYKTSLNQFHWNMEKKLVSMKASNGTKGLFLAMEEEQEALVIEALTADYNLDSGTLVLHGVERIRVADAFICPNNQSVTIMENAELGNLDGAIVIADTLNQNHRIEEAKIRIENKHHYSGHGFLSYDIDHYKKQKIALTTVKSYPVEMDKSVTIAHGEILEKDSFYINPMLHFKGNVDLTANSKLLSFKGQAKIASTILPEQDWFSVDSKVDKRNAFINLNNAKNIDGRNLWTGMFMNEKALSLYTTILRPKEKNGDRNLFNASGIFKVDLKNNRYCFGDVGKVLETASMGNSLFVDKSNGAIKMEGVFSFEDGFNLQALPEISLDVVGTARTNLEKPTTCAFEVSLNWKNHLPRKLTTLLVDDFLTNLDLTSPLLYGSMKNMESFQQLRNWVQEEAAFIKMKKIMEVDGRLQLPPNKIKDICFLNLGLIWSDKTKSFITSKKSLQLATIKNKHIGQQVVGQLEILPDNRRGDRLTYYMTTATGNWYYFSYQAGVLKTVSNNTVYNEQVNRLKKKERRIVTSNRAVLTVELANETVYENFKNRLLNAVD